MTLAGCGFYHILSRADALFSPCSWEAEWKWNTHSHPFAWGLIRSRCLSQILELILQAKPDFVALSGSPCRMYYEDSHCSGNTFAPTPTPSPVPLPVCTLTRPIWWKIERKKHMPKFTASESKTIWTVAADKTEADWTFFLLTRCQFKAQVFRLSPEKL